MLQRNIASPLSRKATLNSLEISQWTARKFDRKVTREINESRSATQDAGRYNKLLIEAERLAEITSLVSQARDLHYRMTKPWADEGLRILPNTLHEKFASEFRQISRKFDAAADAFAAGYPQYIKERERALNGLFDPADYPPADQIRSKFKMRTKTFPIPEADDFRSDVLDQATIEDIKRELSETSEQVLTDAMKDTVNDLAKVIGHMSEKLKTYGKPVAGAKKNYFTDSLVSNVRELAELLPAFNFTNDPKLDAITARIHRELLVEEPKELRENEAARESVQKSAEDILKDVSALLG